MAPTPSSSGSRPSARDQHHHPTTPSKTPLSKHRLHFPSTRTPNPTSAAKDSVPTEHPVEVIGRIRDHPEKKERSASALDVSEDGRSLRLRTDLGYRDFSLDGVSVAEDEDLGVFYRRFVESRVRDVRTGAKCTVMMYGPTGSGKSHTMFGCGKQPGIVYRALRDILCPGEEEKGNSDVDDGGFGTGLFVQVAVLEIYNEEIYDLLSGCNGGGGGGVGVPKGNTPKVRLEVMGKKAKNASYITGNEAGKISREVAKIEKRRIVKSTLCNERSSRSHCLIILDVPTVGGRLMLVDMAGSENIEQAGQIGFEAKLQTAKINQGNTALKRVVESIANGDSHVPFRDSKLTMLLQDSFEDDKSKILMILCASPDPKEMHKTMSTLEYGAKAKCIVRAAHVPTPVDKTDGSSSSVILGSRIAAMNQFICKLQMENRQREKERDEARKELTKKEDEVAGLRVMLKAMEGRKAGANDEEINTRVDERTKFLRVELKRMEEKLAQQETELEALRQKVQVVGVGGSRKDRYGEETLLPEMVGSRFMKRLSEMVAAEGEEDRGMEKSMDLEDMGDVHDVREVVDSVNAPPPSNSGPSPTSMVATFPQRFCLSTVFEGNEEEEEEEEDEEVKKEVVQEDDGSLSNDHILNLVRREMERERELGSWEQGKDSKQSSMSRNERIQNIFRLCGNYREMAHHIKTPTPSKNGPEKISVHPKEPAAAEEEKESQQLHKKKKPTTNDIITTTKSVVAAEKENNRPEDGETAEGGQVDVYVKWETSGEAPGNLIKRMKLLKSATLSDLRKLIEAHFGEENRQQQQFTFLLLGEPNGAPVVGNKEASVPVTKLPVCNNQLAGGRHCLACLRPDKKSSSADPYHLPHLPLGPLENKIQAAAAAVNSTPPSAGRYIAQC